MRVILLKPGVPPALIENDTVVLSSSSLAHNASISQIAQY